MAVMTNLTNESDVIFVPSYDHLDATIKLVTEKSNVKFITQIDFLFQPNHMGVQPRAWEVCVHAYGRYSHLKTPKSRKRDAILLA